MKKSTQCSKCNGSGLYSGVPDWLWDKDHKLSTMSKCSKCNGTGEEK